MLAKPEILYNELLFWIGVLLLNAIHFLPNYIASMKSSSFLPFIKEYKQIRKLGLLSSANQDMFRFINEIIGFIVFTRITGYLISGWVSSSIYILFFFFNNYRFLYRKIYRAEPNLFEDIKLIKTGIAIVWYETKLKLVGYLFLIIVFFAGLSYAFQSFLVFSSVLEPNVLFYIITVFFGLLITRSIMVHKFHTPYPYDIYLRYHFNLAEIIATVKSGYTHYLISKESIGEAFKEKRAAPDFTMKVRPNINFIFIESYGSVLYQNELIKDDSAKMLNAFLGSLKEKGWHSISNYSESPTVSGRSWLAYSSVQYGYKVENNTYYNNFLSNEAFNSSDNIFRVLQKHGYTNYNLNPIFPFKGFSLSYDNLRQFNAIDKWVLYEDIKYQGNTYGLGECPPDQYSLNYTMELINKEENDPYTLFFLTKNSHSPFASPEMVSNWKELNIKKDQNDHSSKGFLKKPLLENYVKAMQYQFDVVSEFINLERSTSDIFIVMGDHQPPIFNEAEEYGAHTPIHVIAQDKEFLKGFEKYGFKEQLGDISNAVKHEGLYSIFLRELMQNFAENYQKLPDYEPDGLQL